MEVIKNLLSRFRHSAVLLLIGFFIIIYVAFGFVYWQQGSAQQELEKQTAQIIPILAKQLPPRTELEAQYNKVNTELALITTDSDAIADIVGIAANSGINTDPESDKLRIPSATVREEKVGGDTYRVMSFKNISVAGYYDNVLAFISDLDSGETQKTMVLKRVSIEQVEIQGEGGAESTTETRATLDVDLYTKPGG